MRDAGITRIVTAAIIIITLVIIVIRSDVSHIECPSFEKLICIDTCVCARITGIA